jgi:hypothetical protein
MVGPRVRSDSQILGKIEAKVFESPIKEDLEDHREDCAYSEIEECTCDEINEANKEIYYENQAMDQYYKDKYDR